MGITKILLHTNMSGLGVIFAVSR